MEEKWSKSERKDEKLNPHVNKCWAWIMSGKLVLVLERTHTHTAFAYMMLISQEGDIIHFSAKCVHGLTSHILLWGDSFFLSWS